MSFPRYPKYKDTGVEWLGRVPEHWDVPPLYLRYEVLLGKMLDEKKLTGENLLPYIRNVDVQWDEVNVSDLPQIDIAPHEKERFTLRKGDLLVCEGGEVGRAAIWLDGSFECAFQKAIHRLRPIGESEVTRFLYYCICFGAAKNVFIAGSNPNTIPHLTGEKFRLYRFPKPPRNEQAQIAAFLDRETAKSDVLVMEQRRLIELLNAKRQAVISHAVMKGLNPHAPMKDSGIKWLGEVPTHWRVVPFGSTIEYQEGPGIMASDFRESGVPLLRISGVQGRWAALDGCNYLDPTKVAARWKHFRLKLGDLLISASASMGTICEVAGDTVGAIPYTGLIRLAPRSDAITKDHVRALVVSSVFSRQIDVLKSGATIQHFGPSHLSRIRIPLPPREEQDDITAYIDRHNEFFDALMAETQRAINLLDERRTALISAAVTGQIDVRQLAEKQAAA